MVCLCNTPHRQMTPVSPNKLNTRLQNNGRQLKVFQSTSPGLPSYKGATCFQHPLFSCLVRHELNACTSMYAYKASCVCVCVCVCIEMINCIVIVFFFFFFCYAHSSLNYRKSSEFIRLRKSFAFTSQLTLTQIQIQHLGKHRHKCQTYTVYTR